MPYNIPPIFGCLLVSVLSCVMSSYAEDTGVPYSRSIPLTTSALNKINELFPDGEIISQRSYWYGNGGQAGNGTSGGFRRWVVVILTKRENGDGPAIEERHSVKIGKGGQVVSRTDPIDSGNVPEVVKEAALSETGGTKILNSYLIQSGSVTRYLVKTDMGGEITLNSNGALVPARNTVFGN